MKQFNREWNKPVGSSATVSRDEAPAKPGLRFEGHDEYDYDDSPLDSERSTMHWHTPRLINFKKVLDSRRYEEEEKEKGAREEEAIEAWHAITGSVDTNSEAAATVNAAQLKHILDEFDLKVDLADIGLEGEKDEQGNTVISFDAFQQFTALTPRVDGGEDVQELRKVAGTVQIHPGSPIQAARRH
mmetsp:Transcript_11000/g.26463  ORF Transcript_11000/g.26463 Transcript_11000/m.26463 type:complete len:186 (+) Transcript_11000:163-720(+)